MRATRVMRAHDARTHRREWDANGITVEICADHGESRLKVLLEREIPPGSLDLQIVISAGMKIGDQAIAVRDGGYMMLPLAVEAAFADGIFAKGAGRVHLYGAGAL